MLIVFIQILFLSSKEETAVAKGIRRISAVTGAEAEAVLRRTSEVKKEVYTLMNKIEVEKKSSLEEISFINAEIVRLR